MLRIFTSQKNPSDLSRAWISKRARYPETTKTCSVHGYKYLPDVIQSLEEEDMKKKEEWKKLMSVRDSLDGFAKEKSELNLKRNPDVETFATLTELPLRMLTRYAPLVSIDIDQFLSV